MAKNPQFSGIQETIDETQGIIWWGEASEFDASKIEGTETFEELETLGLTDAGSITTDAFTIAENTTEGEGKPDAGGLILAQTASTSAPTITFSLTEMPSPNASPLVYANSAITINEDFVSRITGNGTPSNKILVLITLVNDIKHTIVVTNGAFNGRGDYQMNTEDLNSQEVTYGLLADDNGVAIDRHYVRWDLEAGVPAV